MAQSPNFQEITSRIGRHIVDGRLKIRDELIAQGVPEIEASWRSFMPTVSFDEYKRYCEAYGAELAGTPKA